MRSLILLVVVAAAAAGGGLLAGGASAFAPSRATTPRRMTTVTPSRAAPAPLVRQPSSLGDINRYRKHDELFVIKSFRSTGTALGMYNLPPSGPGGPGGGPGGGGPLSDLKPILTGTLTILALIAFFASPLGSAFFFVTNSLLAVAFLAPLALLVGFQLWQFFNTTEGPCPSCGAPIRTLKDDGGNPSICFNCGSLVRNRADGEGLELCNNPQGMYAQDDGGFGGGLFGELFGGGPGGYGEETIVTTTTTTTTTEEERKDRTRRQRTVIDVDAERD